MVEERRLSCALEAIVKKLTSYSKQTKEEKKPTVIEPPVIVPRQKPTIQKSFADFWNRNDYHLDNYPMIKDVWEQCYFYFKI